MSILEKLGLSRKGKFTPILSEKRHKEEAFSLKTNMVLKTLITLSFFAYVIFIFPRTTIQDVSYKLGEPWRLDDLSAPFTFSLLKERDELERERESVRKTTPPIFHHDQTVRSRTQTRVDSLFKHINQVIDAYIVWKSQPRTQQDEQDSLRFNQIRSTSGVGMDYNGWSPLFEQWQILERDRSGIHALKQRIEQVIQETLNDGIISGSKADITSDELTVRDVRDRTERTFFLSAVRDIKDAREHARTRFIRFLKEDMVVTASQLYSLIIEPNYIYSQRDSQTRIEESIQKVLPTKGAVARGQMIIRKGDIITKETLNALQSLNKARSDRASDSEVWQQYFGEIVIISAILLIYFMYIFLYRRPIYDNNAMYLLVNLSISLVLTVTVLIHNSDNLSPYLAPIAITPIILTIIFDSRVGLMTTITLGLMSGLMNSGSFEFVIATVTSCSIAVYSVRDIKNRSQFFLYTPALIFGSILIVYVGFTLSKLDDFEHFGTFVISALGNAFLSSLAAFLLIIVIEKVFKVTTDVTLLELGDTNRPLLKALMLRAPGTFHHSLQVANLSEAAASAIGANSLLCRVASLYHDIGKMDKSEYFVENQSGLNEHDKLKPRMSAIVIKNHVTVGVKMAEEANLPELIIDFIKTHHGNSIIRYFYEKAKQLADDPNEIKEEDFRYEGPLPSTKETGIVMLADSVEASSRTIMDPNYQKLENHIDRIIDEKLSEGQLNNCPLTFADIDKIKETFLKILVGVYHGRVKYPGQEERDKDAADSKKKAMSTD